MFKYEKMFLDISNDLTEETWHKSSFFSTNKDDHLCMCAHGAVQVKVNPVVKDIITNSPAECTRAATPVAAARAAAARAAASTAMGWRTRATAAIKNNPTFSIQEIWDNRPSYVKEDYIFENKNYGNGDAHYLIGMVGLTFTFNDHKDTTLEMIKEKFREASRLAGQLGA